MLTPIKSLQLVDGSGSPIVRDVRTITFPSGTLTDAGNGAVVFQQTVPVTSVFGRTGAVIAQAGDYSTYYDAAGSAAAVLAAVVAGYVPVTRTVNGHPLSANVSVTASDIGLGNVENTALSTWAGSTNITTLGTIATGVWSGTALVAGKLPATVAYTDAANTFTAAQTLGVTSAAALAVGPNGNTNPVLRVVTNVASQADGISISGGAAGAGTTIAALSSGSNSSIILTPKGTGAVRTLGEFRAYDTTGTRYAGFLDNGSSSYLVSSATLAFSVNLATTQASLSTTLFQVHPAIAIGWNGGEVGFVRVDGNTIRVFGASNTSALGSLIVGQATTSTVGLIVRQVTSGTANLFEAQNSSSAAVASIAANGYVTAPRYLGSTSDVRLVESNGIYSISVVYPTGVQLNAGSYNVGVTASGSGSAYINAPAFNIAAATTVTVAGTASTPPVKLTGAWYTGGSATTTKPQLLIEPTGTTSTSWSTSGTGIGVNAPSGFLGHGLVYAVGGTKKFWTDATDGSNTYLRVADSYGAHLHLQGGGSSATVSMNGWTSGVPDGNGWWKLWSAYGDYMYAHSAAKRIGFFVATDVMTGAAVNIASPSASISGLHLRGATSQTANLQEWQNSSGTAIASLGLGNAASSPSFALAGAWYTGGTATTTKPQLLIEPAGTTSTGWSTSGTGIGVNAASGFAGNLADYQVGGVRYGYVDNLGGVWVGNSAQASVGSFNWTANSGGGGTAIYIRGNYPRLLEFRAFGGLCWYMDSVSLSSRVDIGGGTGWATRFNTLLEAVAPTAASIPFKVRGATSQTANLQEWQNSSSVVGAKVTAALEFSNTGAYTNSEMFGAGAVVSGNNGIAIGPGTTVGGQYSIGIGFSVGTGTGSENIIIGNASVTHAQCISIGINTAVTGDAGVVIGKGANAAEGAFALGAYAAASAVYALAIGGVAGASHFASTSIGRYAVSSADYDITLGFADYGGYQNQLRVVSATGNPDATRSREQHHSAYTWTSQPDATRTSRVVHSITIDGVRTEYVRAEGTTGNTVPKISLAGGVTPASLADSAAANGTIYYSTTAGKLVYKDSSGVVNPLY